MQIEILEFLYDNFILVFWLSIFCIIFTITFSGWIIRHQIGTRVLVIRKATAQVIRAKEVIGEGTVEFDKKKYKVYRKDSPSFTSSMLRPFRLYIHPEGSSYVFSPQIISEKTIATLDDDISFQKIINAGIIEKTVSGLVGTTLEKIIYMLAGGTIFLFAWEIIKALMM